MEEIINKNVVGVGFGFYSADDIRRLSVKRITVPFAYDKLDNPVPNGFYDPALGATKNFEVCVTCGLGLSECPGHMGHVELSLPVYHITLMPLLLQLLRAKCMTCHRFRMGRSRIKKYLAILKLLSVGMGELAGSVERIMMARDKMQQSLHEDDAKAAAKLKAAKAKAKGKGKSKKSSSKRGSVIDDEAEDDDADEEMAADEGDDDDAAEAMDDDDDEVKAPRPIGKTVERELDEFIALADRQDAKIAERQQLYGEQPPVMTSHDLDLRKNTINAFLKSIPRRCENCKAFSPGFRKDGFTKIFRLPLNAKQQKQMEALQLTHQDVMDEADAAGFVQRLEKRVADMEAARTRLREEAKASRSEAAKKKRADDKEKKAAASAKGKAKGDDDDDDDAPAPVEEDDDDDEHKPAAAAAAADDSDDDNGGADAAANGALGLSKAQLKAQAAEASKRSTQLVFPNEVEQHMRLLWLAEADILSYMYGQKAPGHQAVQDHSMFFIRVLPVPPSRFRPPGKVAGKMFEHAQNVHFKKIMESDIRIGQLQVERKAVEARAAAALSDAKQAKADAKESKAAAAAKGKGDQKGNAPAKRNGNAKEEKIEKERSAAEIYDETVRMWILMQNEINLLIDSSKDALSAKATGNTGIKQLLERKHGLFRMHMMGKRVNYSCRSVISPDPNLNTNEIGIPDTFACVLTYPEPVNPYNFEAMRQAVINGPEVHPGANWIRDENGRQISLEHTTYQERVALSKTLLTVGQYQPVTNKHNRPVASGMCKKVGRHLRTGDVVLVNRQPTLHKPSIMASKVHVLPGGGRTIRFHYANCATFNADFDGDEINVHFPQSELARSEGYNIAFTDLQYCGPTDGKPLRGLIQDHVGSGVLLTRRDTFLTPAQYQQLLFATLNVVDPNITIKMPVPAILKAPPAPHADYFGGPLYTGKQVVSGVLNAITTGRGGSDDDNAADDDDGGAKKVRREQGINMTSTAKVPVKYCGDEGDVIFRHNELVCGILDKNQFGASSYGLVHCVCELYGAETAGVLLSTLGRLFTNYLQSIHGFTCGIDDMILTKGIEAKRRTLIDGSYDQVVESVSRFADLRKKKPNIDKLRRAVQSKLRVPDNLKLLDQAVMGTVHPLSSKILELCLPAGQLKPFPLNNMSLMTQSGAKGSIVNFSQITCLLGQQELEGKRVPMMATGKSLPCFRKYDPNPRAGGYVTDRFLTGIRPQEYYFHCMAGREGLVDTAVKTSRSGYLQRCLIKHLESLSVNYDYTVRDAEGSVIQFRYGEDSVDVLRAPFLEKFDFFRDNYDTLVGRLNPTLAMKLLDYKTVPPWMEEHRRRIEKNKGAVTETVLNALSPALFGATSDRFADKLNGFSSKLSDDMNVKFKIVMKLNYLKSLAQPGESVGIIAAQSVGEPSTQMTLNTFHLAGHGGANVTLGIPRLREILMTASAKISTPIMELPLVAGKGKKEGEIVARRLRRAILKDWLHDVRVRETMNAATGERLYVIKLVFRDLKEYTTKSDAAAWRDFQRAVKYSFAVKLNAAVKTALRKMADSGESISSRKVKGARVAKAGDGDDAAAKKKSAADDAGSDDDGGVRADAANEEYDAEDDDDIKALRELDQQSRKEREEQDADGAEVTSEAAGEARRRAAKAKRKADAESKAQADAEAPIDESADAAPEEGDAASKASVDGGESEDDETESPAWTAKQERTFSMCQFIKSVNFGQETDSRQNVHHTAEVTVAVGLGVKKLLVMGMTESVCAVTLVRSTPGIGLCFVMERVREDAAPPKPGQSNKEVYVQTDGVNFSAIWRHGDLIDLKRINTNDIHQVLRTYGVEAARASIVKQVSSVFKVYSIAVSNRHLGLIADYMTFMGGFRPLSRIGIENNASPFQKITFETSIAFMKSACLGGDRDHMTAPSSRLAVGRPIASGTGAFDLFQPLHY